MSLEQIFYTPLKSRLPHPISGETIKFNRGSVLDQLQFKPHKTVTFDAGDWIIFKRESWTPTSFLEQEVEPISQFLAVYDPSGFGVSDQQINRYMWLTKTANNDVQAHLERSMQLVDTLVENPVFPDAKDVSLFDHIKSLPSSLFVGLVAGTGTGGLGAYFLESQNYNSGDAAAIASFWGGAMTVAVTGMVHYLRRDARGNRSDRNLPATTRAEREQAGEHRYSVAKHLIGGDIEEILTMEYTIEREEKGKIKGFSEDPTGLSREEYSDKWAETHSLVGGNIANYVAIRAPSNGITPTIDSILRNSQVYGKEYAKMRPQSPAEMVTEQKSVSVENPLTEEAADSLSDTTGDAKKKYLGSDVESSDDVHAADNPAEPQADRKADDYQPKVD